MVLKRTTFSFPFVGAFRLVLSHMVVPIMLLPTCAATSPLVAAHVFIAVHSGLVLDILSLPYRP